MRPVVSSVLVAATVVLGLQAAHYSAPDRTEARAPKVVHPSYALASSNVTWGVQLQAPHFSGASCPTVMDCFVVGDENYTASSQYGLVVYSTSTSGRSWSNDNAPTTVPGGGPPVLGSDGGAISCSNANTCVVIAGIVNPNPSPLYAVVTTDAGATWSVYEINGAFGPGFSSVSCVDASSTSFDCWAVAGSGVEVSTDGGQTWSSETVPASVTYLNGISCANTSDCWAVGGGQNGTSPVIIATTNGGSGWSTETVPSSVTGLNGI